MNREILAMELNELEDEFEEEDDEEEEEGDPGEELQLALSMLEDVQRMMEEIIELGAGGRIQGFLYNRLVTQTIEINAFLDQYVNVNDGEKHVMDMGSLEWLDV